MKNQSPTPNTIDADKPELPADGRSTVSVDTDALYEVLDALVNKPSSIRELQATMNPALEKLNGRKNPINQLIEDYNSSIS